MPPRRESNWKDVTAGALLLAALLLFDGWREQQVLARGTPVPARVTLADLSAGRVSNIHVTVTGFVFGEGRVVEEKDGTWNRVWIPLLVAGEASPRVGAVVRSFRIESAADLRAFLAKTEVTGTIVNDVDGRLGGDEADLLRERNPGLDPARMPLIHERRSFPTEGGIRLRLYGGGVLMAVAAVCAWRWLATR